MAKNKKCEIVQAAYELFLENGYDNSSVKMIAERAGVAQGLMYNFFESKEILFDEVLSMAHDMFRVKMMAIAEEHKDSPPEEYIERYADAILENREEAIFLLSSSLTPRLRERAKPILKAYSDGMIGMMEPLFPGLPDELLYDIGSLLLAVSDSFIVDGDRERAVRAGLFVIEIFSKYTADLKKGELR